MFTGEERLPEATECEINIKTFNFARETGFDWTASAAIKEKVTVMGAQSSSNDPI